MALEHAILVSLAERSASGYDLARRFDASIGFFWKASHQQIYKVLARMESDGWVAGKAVTQHGRPDKKVYELSTGGRVELTRWSRTRSPVDPLRSDFAVKVRGMNFGDRHAVIEDIAQQRSQHAAQLDYYLANEQHYYPDPDALTDELLPGYLVLRGGIRYERGVVEWCDEMLAAMAAR